MTQRMNTFELDTPTTKVQIGDHHLSVKEFKSVRVCTFRDIDEVHQRPDGTAGRNFRDNASRFHEGEDYFRRNPSEARDEFGITAPNGLVLISESGYLMLTKSMTDDLSWDIQRLLVNNYFRKHQSTPMTSLEMIAQMATAMVEQERQLHTQGKQVAHLTGTVEAIKDTVATGMDNWRDDIKRMINRIIRAIGEPKIQEARRESYKMLENRAKVDLERRLANQRGRMLMNGGSKTAANALNKMDVIEADPKLREIYFAIIKEMTIKYLP